MESERRYRSSSSSDVKERTSANAGEFVARFQTTKISWKGKYERIFALSPTRFCTIDPKDFGVTNSWSYSTFMAVDLDANDSQVGL